MSKKYDTPNMEIVWLETMDVIRTSLGGEDTTFVEKLPSLDSDGDF